jgi:hypothetical protein
VIGYPLGALREELAFLAYYLHWSQGELLSLEHAERRRWVEEVSRINDQLTRAARD